MVGAVAVLVNSVLSPIVDVNIAQTAHEQLHTEAEDKKMPKLQMKERLTFKLIFYAVLLVSDHLYTNYKTKIIICNLRA